MASLGYAGASCVRGLYGGRWVRRVYAFSFYKDGMGREGERWRGGVNGC